jgi:hypothetical protein
MSVVPVAAVCHDARRLRVAHDLIAAVAGDRRHQRHRDGAALEHTENRCKGCRTVIKQQHHAISPGNAGFEDGVRDSIDKIACFFVRETDIGVPDGFSLGVPAGRGVEEFRYRNLKVLGRKGLYRENV